MLCSEKQPLTLLYAYFRSRLNKLFAEIEKEFEGVCAENVACKSVLCESRQEKTINVVSEHVFHKLSFKSSEDG